MNASSLGIACPANSDRECDRITLAHGDGARLTRKLIQEHILPVFGTGPLTPLGDAASLPGRSGPIAFTADSFVVSPIFFSGGDIGKLAVYGTVNDLAVAGAKPLWLSISLIIEEGFSIESLDRVLQSIADAASRVGVMVVTGDTKIVPLGAADGLFISVAGIGELVPPIPQGPAHLEPGDELIVSGSIGRHGIAILAARENLGFVPPPESDCGPLFLAVDALRRAGIPLRCLRDATRGGVTSVLHEWSSACGHTLRIEEMAIPVSADVRGACELLGLDPLNMANEGTMLIAVAPGSSSRAVQVLHALAETQQAARIGEVRPRATVPVTIRRSLGVEQSLDEPSSTPLPRIC